MGLKRIMPGGVDVKFTLAGPPSRLHAAAAVAQSVKRPKLWSLKEVQLIRREFDSWSQQRSLGKAINPSHAICGSVRHNTCTQK